MEADLYIMTYENKKHLIRILGEEFVKNNKNKGKLIINNKKYPLTGSVLKTDILKSEKNRLKMLLNKNIYNKSYMFKDISSLLSLEIENDIMNKKFVDNYVNINNNKIAIEIKEEEENLFDNIIYSNLDRSLFYDIYENSISAISPISSIISINKEEKSDNSILKENNVS